MRRNRRPLLPAIWIGAVALPIGMLLILQAFWSYQEANAAPTQTQIEVSGFAFNPEAITVTVGTTVTWTNADPVLHNVIGSDWGSADFGEGESYSYAFDSPGSYDYVCTIHPFMNGSITVSGLAALQEVGYLPLVMLDGEGVTPVASDATTVRSGSWSDPATWGGRVPISGDIVTVSAGHELLLDINTAALGGLNINGQLTFDAQDLVLTSDWILIMGSNAGLHIGSESEPFTYQATITLTDTDEEANIAGEGVMAMGTKFLGTMLGGTLELHGIRGQDVSWTQLGDHAAAGATAITLADPVEWRVGDLIVIAPSGYDAAEAEERTITAVSADGLEISLNQALSYPHYGQIETISGKEIDMRAEVGLLTRNIRIEAPASSDATEFGFHTMFMPESTVHIDGVEMERGGQKGHKGRYSVHWHLAEDATGDYIRNSAIRNSYQRGINVHGTHNVLVENNVVYNVFSHAYVFSEDGTEYNNRFVGNLSVLVKNPDREDFSFPVDGHFQSGQGENRPSGFWGVNYYNALIDNHAAGSINGNGFHFDGTQMSHTIKTTIIRAEDPIEFRGNLSHSTQTTLRTNPTYGPLTRGHGLMLNRYGGDDGVPLYFEDFQAYKNENAGVWMENERHILRNAILVDSSAGAIVMRSTIEDAVISQKSPNEIGGVMGESRSILDAAGGMGGGVNLLRSSYGLYPTIKNVTFEHVEPAAVTVHKLGNFRETVRVENVTLINSSAILFGHEDPASVEGMILDVDGSLTGTNSPTGIGGSAIAEDATFNSTFNAYIAPMSDP